MNKPNSTTKNEQKARRVVGYYVSVIKQFPKYVIGILVTVPVTIVVNNFLPPLVIADALRLLSARTYTPDELWSIFGGHIVLYTVIALVGIGTWRLVDYFTWRLEIRVQQIIAEQVFQHLMSESADFHASSFGGSLVSQSNKLLSSYVRMADTTIFQLLPMLVSILATIIILTPKAPYFVAGLIGLSAVYVFVALKISVPIRQIAAAWAAAESRQTGYLADAITNVMTIKSYARGNQEMKRFHSATNRTKLHAFRFASLHQKQMNAFGVIGRTIAAGAFVLAIVSVVMFGQNVATVFLIVSFTATITEHLFRFGNDSMRAYNRSVGDAFDMAEILATKPVVLDPIVPEKSVISRGAINFHDVTFTHKGSHNALFKHLNVRIRPGEKVGLVGHSGSGKTTFTRLLMRFSDIDSGSIQIDGQDISNITQDSLHEAIAFVPQEPMLFHRTLAENIRYGDATASDETVAAVARMAHAEEFIVGLPEGLNTLVGERGVKLSGGQRQRVAIARAMLKNAPILLLDEATSALDSESEALIQDALWKLMEGRTAIVIAHRLSTIQRMDRILVMSDGEIVEEGSHKTLLESGGQYAKLWARQSGGFIES